MFSKVLMERVTVQMGSLHGFTFEKGLKEMFSQICKSAGRVPRIRKRKSGLGPFNRHPLRMT